MKTAFIEEKIDALATFLAALVMLVVVLVNGEIAIGLVLAFLSFPLCKSIAKKLYNRRE